MSRAGFLFAVCLFAAGCGDSVVIRSYREYVDTVGKAFVHYVENDPKLTAEAKKRRLQAHYSGVRVLEGAERGSD